MRRLLFLAFVSAACAKAPAPAAPREEPLDAQFAGCAAVVSGPVCELGAARVVRVFVAGAAPGARDAAITFEGATASDPARDVPGGLLFTLRVDEAASRVAVVASRGEARARFTLNVASAKPMPWLAAGNALREKGDLDGAEARAHEAAPGDREQAASAGLLARVALRRGKIDDAVAHFRRAIALGRAAGRLSEQADDATALAFTLDERAHRFDEARAVLDQLDADVGSYPEGAARAPFYRGQLAFETADPRTALRLLEESRIRAERLGMARLSRTARHMIAQQLVYLAREEEALARVRALEKELASATDASPCEQVELALTAGFAELRLGARGGSDDNARAIASNGACADAYLRAIALGNLAQAEARGGQRDLARAHLDEARAAIREPRLSETLFWLDVEAGIALAEHDPARALAIYEREASIAEASHAYPEAWRAALGRGESLEARGMREGAARAYEEAETLLERHSLAIPLGEGRAGFLGQSDRSARLLVDLLVRLGRPADAMAVARRARARVLSGVALAMRVGALDDAARARWEKAIGDYQRARELLEGEAALDWKLSRSALLAARASREARGAALRASLDEALAVVTTSGQAPPEASRARTPPREGELLLAYYPAQNGWIAFASDAAGVTTFRADDLRPDSSPASLAERLLVPAKDKLARARRVRVLPYGWLRAIDFHALPFRGEPLVASVAVEYALDLPAARPAIASGAALVVSDPTDDLPATRVEAAAVAVRLRDAGWSVVRVEGRDATSARVRQELPRAALFHYAGHGLFAGHDGIESALPLASGGSLTLGDIFALGATPSRVVLSGCDAARTTESDGAEGLGLAQAFVLAGADFVIAPWRKVDDASAATLSAALAKDLSRSADGAEVLRAAQNRLRAASDPSWAAFRVVAR